MITLVWAGLYTRALVDESFQAPAEIIPVVLIAVGFILGGEILKIRRNGRNGNGG